VPAFAPALSFCAPRQQNFFERIATQLICLTDVAVCSFSRVTDKQQIAPLRPSAVPRKQKSYAAIVVRILGSPSNS
jgi:hypothetical protein